MLFTKYLSFYYIVLSWGASFQWLRYHLLLGSDKSLSWFSIIYNSLNIFLMTLILISPSGILLHKAVLIFSLGLLLCLCSLPLPFIFFFIFYFFKMNFFPCFHFLPLAFRTFCSLQRVFFSLFHFNIGR